MVKNTKNSHAAAIVFTKSAVSHNPPIQGDAFLQGSQGPETKGGAREDRRIQSSKAWPCLEQGSQLKGLQNMRVKEPGVRCTFHM